MDEKIKKSYEILGVSIKERDIEKIKRTFRLKAKKLHPDKVNIEGASEERFKELEEAKDIVLEYLNKVKRMAQKQNNHPEGWEAYFSGDMDVTGNSRSNDGNNSDEKKSDDIFYDPADIAKQQRKIAEERARKRKIEEEERARKKKIKEILRQKKLYEDAEKKIRFGKGEVLSFEQTIIYIKNRGIHSKNEIKKIMEMAEIKSGKKSAFKAEEVGFRVYQLLQRKKNDEEYSRRRKSKNGERKKIGSNEDEGR